MTLNEAAINAEVILIEGDRGAGKNTLVTHFLSLLDPEHQSIALITIPKTVYQKKQEIYKNMTHKTGYPFKSIFFLSDEWHDLKRNYGLHFLINDIEKILDTTDAKILYIQRIDELFNITDQSASFEVISNIARLALNRNIKLLISVLKPSDNYAMIKEMLVDYTDLTVLIKSDHNHNGRTVQAVSSYFPVAASLYEFMFKDQQFILQEKNTTKQEIVKKLAPVFEKSIIHLIIISQESNIISWSTYLFGNFAQVSVKFFRNSSELTSEIWEQCDAVVFSSDSAELIFDFASFARTMSETAKIFGWFTEGYIRTEDRIKAHQCGCDDIFGPKTRVVDYVLSLEKSLNTPFYSKMIDNNKQSMTVDSFDDFRKIVEDALQIHRIFTIFIFRYTTPCNDAIIGNLFREEDVAYFDTKQRMIYLLFMNAEKNDRDILSQKLLRVKSDIVHVKSIEAPDLFGGKEVLKNYTLALPDSE